MDWCNQSATSRPSEEDPNELCHLVAEGVLTEQVTFRWNISTGSRRFRVLELTDLIRAGLLRVVILDHVLHISEVEPESTAIAKPVIQTERTTESVGHVSSRYSAEIAVRGARHGRTTNHPPHSK